MLLFFELHLGRGPNPNDGHAAGQLGQAFLQLLAVPVGIRVIDLVLDLGYARFDFGLGTGPFDDRGVVFVHHDLAGAAEKSKVHVLQLEAHLFGDDLAAGEYGDIGQHGLATVAEPGCLHHDTCKRPPELVDDKRRQCFPVDVLGYQHKRLTRLHDTLEDGD